MCPVKKAYQHTAASHTVIHLRALAWAALAVSAALRHSTQYSGSAPSSATGSRP